MITEKQYLEYLIKQYQNLIYSICLKSVGNPFDAEDLTQEVFLSEPLCGEFVAFFSCL